MKTGYDRKGVGADCSLSDGVREFFFDLRDLSMLQQPVTPSTVQFSQGGGEFGDFEPQHSHIEQKDWQGGRGRYRHSEDETAFFDSKAANTMIPGRVVPMGQVRFAEGAGSSESLLPGASRRGIGDDVDWVQMSTSQYARPFTTTSAFTATRVFLWIRKIGTPVSNLQVEIYANSGGSPTGAALASDTIAAADCPDHLSYLWEADLEAGTALSDATTYHVVVYADMAGDGTYNHWEVGYGTGHSGQCKLYVTSWENTDIQIYCRVAPAHIKRQWHYFEMEAALYKVGKRADGTADSLWINGDRGEATSATSTTLVDTNKSWTADRWIGAWVKITRGTGKGQFRQITDNASTSLTVSAWDQTPDSTSEYVIYSTDEWTQVTLSGDSIPAPVEDVTVMDEQAVLCFGDSTTEKIMRIRWDNSGDDHDGRDEGGSDYADRVHAFYDPAQKSVTVWRGENSKSEVKVSYSKKKSWGTNLDFKDDIPVGGADWEINRLFDFDGKLYVAKQDDLWYIANERANNINVGLRAMADTTNGLAAVAWKLFIYLNWSHSIEQVYSGSVLDMGPWLHAGLPSGRRGYVSAIEPVHAFMLCAVNGGTSQTSSILAWNERGYHDVFQAWQAGREINSIHWQACPGARPRMWFDCGGETMVMEWPFQTLNSLNDPTYVYTHECYVTQSTIDLNKRALPKIFQELTMATENLADGIEIRVQYQIDEDIGGDDWVNLGDFRYSPFEEREIGEGGRTSIRLRYILRTNDADTPPVMLAPVVEGFARIPVKYQWIVESETNTWSCKEWGQNDPDPDDFVDWLEAKAAQAHELTLRSRFKRMDDIRVLIEPPVVDRQIVDEKDASWAGAVQFAIREA